MYQMCHNLKSLTPGYKPQATDLFIKTFPEFPPEDFEISWQARSKDNSFAILDAKSKFIGFVIASFHSSNGKNLYVDYIALKHECRGSGLGTILLKKLVSNAFHKNSSIHLYPENEGLVSWYTRNGFYPTHDGYYNFHSYNTRRQSIIHKSLNLNT
jgi:ribosomal protein S18 acetylase RimI-like enzyme